MCLRRAGSRPERPDKRLEALLQIGLSQLLQPLAHQRAGHTHVHAHVSLAAGAEHLAVVKGQMGLVYEEVEQLTVAQMQVATV